MVKRLSTVWETWVQSLGQEDPLEKEMAIHSSTIAWKIPWTEEPSRLQSMGSQRVRHDFTFTFTFAGSRILVDSFLFQYLRDIKLQLLLLLLSRFSRVRLCATP